MPKTVNVGLIGYAFMGKAHSAAFRDVPIYFPDVKLKPVMKSICGRDERAVREAANRLGWEEYETDAMTLIRRDDIQVVDVCSPGWAHKDQVIAAAKAGKHIICEKPIGNNLKEAKAMANAVNAAGVQNTVMFNYRRIPAMSYARDLIRAGEIGEIRHFRAFYLQDWISDPDFPMVWRLDKKQAGSGTLGDIGSHIIDMGRFLVGEIDEVVGTLKTFVKERPIETGSRKKARVTVDDATAFIANFDNGAIGTFEATRFARGRKNYNGFEIYGSKGSLLFNFEDMNRLQFLSTKDNPLSQGFRDIIVTEPGHPYVKGWWPPGHIIGYQHTFAHAIYDFLNNLAKGKSTAPDINDGVMVQAVLEAVEMSDKQRGWVRIKDLL
ncbi:MAG: Gfo/Idh/MocA family protein [Candidatus Sumerlaeaceae bacterium]